MTWYPKSDADWHPDKPAVGQVALGALVFLALAGVSVYWAAGESESGNRIFLWVVAGVLAALAAWRIALGIRLVREDRRRRRADCVL